MNAVILFYLTIGLLRYSKLSNCLHVALSIM